MFESLRSLRDFYQDFDACTRAFVDDEQEAEAIIEYTSQYTDARIDGVVTFLEWYQDQRKDGKL